MLKDENKNLRTVIGSEHDDVHEPVDNSWGEDCVTKEEPAFDIQASE